MKKLFFYFQMGVLCCLSFLFTSCFTEEDFGYPEKLSVPAEGGEVVAKGEQPFWYASIQDYKGNQGSRDYLSDDMEAVEYDWLRVEYIQHGTNEVMVIAKPNTTGKSRRLYIELYNAQEYAVIEVKQDSRK